MKSKNYFNVFVKVKDQREFAHSGWARKRRMKSKVFAAVLLSMLFQNFPCQAQSSEDDAALGKFTQSMEYIKSENQDERVQGFYLLKEAAHGGVMEACGLMGSLCEEEELYADAAMYYMEALKMRIVASDNNDDIQAAFNDSRRGFLRATLIDATSKSPIENKAVDMGLSVKWSNCNYKASNIEDAGSVMSHVDAMKIEEKGYRLPTDAEWEELVDNCVWVPAVIRGVSGFMVFGKGESRLVYGTQPDNVMFLPGGFESLSYTEGGIEGFYWTSDCADETNSRFFTFYNNDTLDMGSGSKDLQFCIRLVKTD